MVSHTTGGLIKFTSKLRKRVCKYGAGTVGPASIASIIPVEAVIPQNPANICPLHLVRAKPLTT